MSDIISRDGYVHKPGIVYKNQFHIIWCPKYRCPVLVDGVDTRLKEIILEVASMHETNVLSMEVMPDHVHLFIEFDPRRMLHKIIKDMKGISSRKLREEFPHLKKRLPTLWTKTYFSCTVGHISEATIKRYISEQKTRSETRREWKARRDNSILHP